MDFILESRHLEAVIKIVSVLCPLWVEAPKECECSREIIKAVAEVCCQCIVTIRRIVLKR